MPGFSSSVSNNINCVFANNGDFSGNAQAADTNGLQTNGQLWIGSTALNVGNTHINVGTITSPLGTITIGYSSPNITIDLAGSAAAVETLSDDVGTIVTPSANNIQLTGHVNNQTGKFSTTVAGLHLMKINPMSSARWIVDSLGFNGTHTTIASAMSAATSGDTIFIMPGTYTENVTLTPGVNLTAWGSDSSLNQTGKVIILGNLTLSAAGSVTIYGVQLQTNSGNILTVSGSGASILNVNNCNLNCTNNTGISFTTSNTSATINISHCTGDLGTTGIAFYTMSSTGKLNISYSSFTNTGASTTASSNSAGIVFLRKSNFFSPFSSSSSSITAWTNSYCDVDTSATNTTCFTSSGTGTSGAGYGNFISGTASAVSVGSGTTFVFEQCVINSTNTNALTGAGTYSILNTAYIGSSHQVNITTQSTAGAAFGLTQGSAPSAGAIGEQISSAIASGSAVGLTNNTVANITTISLTAGIWDVSALGAITCTGANTVQQVSIVTTSATNGNSGDNLAYFNFANAGINLSLAIPSFRITLSATTTIFFTAMASFTTGTAVAYGRISGTRVG